jgi:hypothetical protein
MSLAMTRLRSIAPLTLAVMLAASPVPAHMDDGAHHEAPKGMRVRLEAMPSGMGFSLHLKTRKFRFTPQRADGKHRRGAGHAHLWVDGVKTTRIYGPWHYVGNLTPGRHEIRVTLNGNDHADYVGEDGDVVEALFVGDVAMPTP